MSAIIIDTESTGKIEPIMPVEVGYMYVDEPGDKPRDPFVQKYNPGKPIELGAQAVHMIIDDDVQDCPPSSSFVMPDDAEYMIGHNVDYDWKVLNRPQIKRICTLVLARYTWPTLDSHTQTALVLSFNPRAAREWLRQNQSHSALVDIRMCERILNGVIQALKYSQWGDEMPTWEQVYQLCESLRVPEIISFGKHNGKRFADLPADYLDWYINKSDNPDPYTMKACVLAYVARGDTLYKRLNKQHPDAYDLLAAIRS